VEKATTFFRSLSVRAHIAPTNIVTLPNTNISKPPNSSFNKTHKPAVTRVEEWTKAETGVGAAIAAGSQAEKGNWADLHMENSSTTNRNPQVLFRTNKLKARTKNTSPMRLNNTVFIAPFLEREDK
jgi:hypothetical protein